MKSYILLFVVICSVLFSFTSCNKDEILPVQAPLKIEAKVAQPVDTLVFQTQLSLIKNLTKTEVRDSMLSKSHLKDASIPDLNHIRLKPTSKQDYYVNNNEAVKIYDYSVTDLGGYISEEFGIYQTFQILNGIVDSLNYSIRYEVGPPSSSSRGFYLSSNNYLVRTAFHFHCDNGEQIDFYGNSNNSYYVLPNYPNGFWQLVFDYNINGRPVTYESLPIDYYAESNELYLNLQLKAENSVSIIEFDKSLIIGATRLEIQGYDESGIYRYMTIPVVYNENMPNIVSFSAPIDISFVYISGNNFCNYFQAKCVGIKTGNISVFNLEKIW